MLATSALWKELAASGSARLETAIAINGQEYTPASVVTVNRASMQSALTVGACVTATARFSLRPVSGLNVQPSDAAVLKCRFVDGYKISEWQTMGTFYISKQQSNPAGGLLAFQGFDAMQNADKVFSNLSGFPKAMTSVVSEIAHEMGLEVDSRTWDIIETGLQYRVPLPSENERMIKVLGYIGGVCGGSWIITPLGRLRLVPILSSAAATGAANKINIVGILHGVSVGDSLSITGVRANSGTRTMVAGNTSGGVIVVPANPYVELGRRTASAILSRYEGAVYTPYEIKSCIYDPAVEIGDYIISRSDIQSVVYQETARYAPAFRGDLSAPFPTETSETEQSISDAIGGSDAMTMDLSVRFYKFVSQSAVTIGDGQSVEIINFDFAAGAGQDVVFHAEVKHTTETTETGSDAQGWTCTDALLTVTYYINGAEVETYHPVKTETDGSNLLHLNYHFENGDYTSGNFRVTLSLSGGTVSVEAGDARAYIVGQGCVDSLGDWIAEDGLVFVGVESYPDKLFYETGEELDLTGLVIKAYYADGTEIDVTAQCTISPSDGEELNEGETEVEISYTEDRKEYCDSFSVYAETNSIQMIYVAAMPTKTTYYIDIDTE